MCAACDAFFVLTECLAVGYSITEARLSTQTAARLSARTVHRKIKNPQPKRHTTCLRGEGTQSVIPHGSTRAFYSFYSVFIPYSAFALKHSTVCTGGTKATSFTALSPAATLCKRPFALTCSVKSILAQTPPLVKR